MASSSQAAAPAAAAEAVPATHDTPQEGEAGGPIPVETLRVPVFEQIAALSLKHKRGVNVLGRVVRVLALLEHTGMDGEAYRDADVYIGDETACIRVQASGVHVEPLLQVGSTVIVRNAFVEVVGDVRRGGTSYSRNDPLYLRLKQFSKVTLVRTPCRSLFALLSPAQPPSVGEALRNWHTSPTLFAAP